MADLVPVDHQPEFDEADQAAMMPETFANPAVKAAIEHIASGTKKLVTAPGDIAKPNPYPEGSELASAYEDQRQKGMTNWAPQMALAMLGGGAGGVEGGGAVVGSGAVRKAAPAALDMSQEARMARAAEQGFDASTPLYHGTSKDADFKKFKDSRHGTWTTTDPESASMYARENDSKGLVYDRGKYEPVNSADRVLPLYGKPLQNPYTGPVPDSIRTASNYKKAQSDWFDQLKRQGYDGVDMGGGVRVDFDNANLRSQFAPFDPKNQGKSMLLGSGATDQKTAAMLQAIRAYHGSPHDFDAFDMSKIGTGEGAQSYGHGLYFAENEPVAKSYKAAGPAANAQYDAINNRLSALAKEMDANSSGYRNFKDKELGAKQAAEYDSLMAKKSDVGHMYEVNINADPKHFLDWDKPLNQQSDRIANVLPDILRENTLNDAELKHFMNTKTGQDAIQRIARPSYPIRADKNSPWEASGAKSYDEALAMVGGDKSRVNRVLTPDRTYTTEALRNAGIPGIKYADQGSRITGDAAKIMDNYGSQEKALDVAQQRLKAASTGSDRKYWDGIVQQLQKPQTSNYVVFNDKLIDILRKYGIAGLPAAGAATGAMQSQPGPADMVNAIRGQGGG